MMVRRTYFIAGALILLAFVFPALIGADGGSASETHDVGVVSCIKQGPPAINLSDTGGAYMYMQCQIKNFSGHDEMVVISNPGKF